VGGIRYGCRLPDVVPDRGDIAFRVSALGSQCALGSRLLRGLRSLLTVLIHPGAWKANSPKFALRSSHPAYKDTPFWVYAWVLLGTTI
jgi:hypothetical protein